jgi:hypothetical protein
LAIVLILALFLAVEFLNWGEIGPATESARMALIVVLLAGAFGTGHAVIGRRAAQLGLLCPSCGRYPLGLRRLRYGTQRQVEVMLDDGRCDWCRRALFHWNGTVLG